VTRWVGALLRRYAAGQAAAVAPYVVGHRVLDLGAAEHWVAATLAARTRRATWVCGVDVGAHRRARGPYVVYDGARLPFGEHAFDTTLALLTLHHCRTPETVLDEALRVTRRRLIVIESVWRTPVERFWLRALDGRVNRFRHDGRMAPALNVRRPEQWRALFESRGLTIAHERWLGSAWERLVHHPLLFALDVTASAAAEIGGAVVGLTARDEAAAPGPARSG
jgi:SAM-dependent methyltransferase